MAVLRIIIEVDDRVKDIHEFDTAKQGLDPIQHFWDFMRNFKLRLDSQSFSDYFGKKKE